jgi:hypothetical protein
MSTDLNETLAGMQALAEGQAAGYKRMLELNGGIGKLGVRHPDLFDAMIQWGAYSTNGHADTVLALLAAVRNVLALHTPFEWSFGYGPVQSCRECARLGASESDAQWPCATYKALTDALGSERSNTGSER